ncbi:hypothetical protein FNV43_RR11882 [Rhamnella rubrinervis]|uniref:Uncharacterized protein n=1 Tax=Rhamnella rubrinervis TaxID=2594499 RepID=A0A8K0H6D1_9ROSA|nr:hypothetical protein FNV43_RR11882 [Rhamnella rubrinervis]
MGSCISKCIPRKHSQLEEFDHHHHHHDVQDKLVIFQAPTSSTTPNNIIPLSNKISPSPPSPSNSSTTSSVSSFTCTTTSKYSSSSSTTSSSASSVICSKNRSFSNEYLWSCYKENPHIIRINSPKETITPSSLPAKPRKLEAAKQQPSHRKVSNCSSTTPQKRVRSRSPTLTRKKSFRKDQPEICNIYTYSLQESRSLRSPSPSRRFSNTNNGDKYGGVHATNSQKLSQSKRMSGTGTTTLLDSKVNTAAYASGLSYSRMENLRPPTPNSICSSSRLGPPCLRSTRETFIHRIGSKIDEFAVGEALAHPDNGDAIPMEDIDNPLISLDCFIFL